MSDLWVPPSAREEAPKTPETPQSTKGESVDFKPPEVSPEHQEGVDKANELFAGQPVEVLQAFLNQPDVLSEALESLRGPIGSLATQCQRVDRNNIYLNFKQNVENALVKQDVIKGVHKLKKIDRFTAVELIRVLASLMNQVPTLNLETRVEDVPQPDSEEPSQPE